MIETLYLIRHAEPDRSANVQYNVAPGPPLTDRGRQEAVQVASWLAVRGIEQLLSSPFQRTSETADAIAEQLGIDVHYVEALREGGPGELFERVQGRVAELLGQLDDSPYRQVALVTHGACIRGALMHTTGGKLDLSKYKYDYGNHSPTAGVWRGTRSKQGWCWELAFYPGKPSEPTPITEPIQPIQNSIEWV